MHRAFVPLILAFLPALASAAPTFEASGLCPGPTTVHVKGITPNGSFAILRSNVIGNSTIPVGVCAGTRLRLADNAFPNNLRMHGIVRADANGEKEFDPELLGTGCPANLQFLDLTTCDVSQPGRVYQAPTCAPGTLVRETQLSGWLVSNDSMTLANGMLYVTTFMPPMGNQILEVDPVTMTTTNVYTLPIWGGNAGISYDPFTDRIWQYTTSSVPGSVSVVSADGSSTIANYNAPVGTGAGAVDPTTGNLWLSSNSGNGVRGFDAAFNPIGTFAAANWVGDFEIAPDGGSAYGVDLNAFDIVRWDFDALGQPELTRWDHAFGGVAGNAWEFAVNADQQIYSINQSGDEMWVWDRFGRELASWPLVAGSVPNSVLFSEATDTVLVGSYDGGVATIREYCGLP